MVPTRVVVTGLGITSPIQLDPSMALGAVEVDATSKKTIGVANCKLELSKKLVDKGACSGKKKGERLEYGFKFGKDGEPNQATGTSKLDGRRKSWRDPR